MMSKKSYDPADEIAFLKAAEKAAYGNTKDDDEKQEKGWDDYTYYLHDYDDVPDKVPPAVDWDYHLSDGPYYEKARKKVMKEQLREAKSYGEGGGYNGWGVESGSGCGCGVLGLLLLLLAVLALSIDFATSPNWLY